MIRLSEQLHNFNCERSQYFSLKLDINTAQKRSIKLVIKEILTDFNVRNFLSETQLFIETFNHNSITTFTTGT